MPSIIQNQKYPKNTIKRCRQGSYYSNTRFPKSLSEEKYINSRVNISNYTLLYVLIQVIVVLLWQKS